MDGLHRIVVSGRNNVISPTAFQDTAASHRPEPGMEIYMAYLHGRQAGEWLLKAHTLRERDKRACDHYHRMAMGELDKLAEALGLDLVPRGEAVTR